jgi:alkylated DNA repair dioxygenase AlkB
MDVDVDAMPVPGLRYVAGYLDGDAQTRLLAEVDSQPWQHAGGRGVQIYGYSYHHLKGGIYRLGDLPAWALDVAARIQRDGLMPHLADQMIVNAYEPGAGISAHVDLSAFDDAIAAISLGSTCVMQFAEKASGREEALLLEPGSALVLSGEARSQWTHAIPARTSDLWQNRELVRGRRVSLTFRRMLYTSGTFTS